tara:strand:+ start:823 stop:1323 length:501 start_codon:yes stop_codon:yes gene_type:complete
MFKINNHNNHLYNTLLKLSRNIFFYKEINLEDTFETRIYLMFVHFSILMIIFKKKGSKLDQKSYDYFFHNIEYNLRELGFGDVTVNKKMKEFNKILYDILLKLDKKKDINNTIHLNYDLFINYFDTLKGNKNSKYTKFEDYFVNFFNFCFELPLENMLKEIENFKK